jgi:hypothetical protein
MIRCLYLNAESLEFSSMNEENRLLVADNRLSLRSDWLKVKDFKKKLPIVLEEFKNLYTN